MEFTNWFWYISFKCPQESKGTKWIGTIFSKVFCVNNGLEQGNVLMSSLLFDLVYILVERGSLLENGDQRLKFWELYFKIGKLFKCLDKITTGSNNINVELINTAAKISTQVY